MSNLLHTELAKLFRSKALWITILVYAVSITGTFVPLSYADGADLPGLTGMDMVILEQELLDADEMLEALLRSDNFVKGFYQTSSGHSLVVMVFVILFVLSDLRGRTVQGTLLCGYSRTQVYLAKLACGILGSWLFYALSMVNALLIGMVFYGTRPDLAMAGTLLQILAAQCLSIVQYAAVFTAFAFLFGNAWAFPASFLFFLALPGIPLLAALLRGLDFTFTTSFLPSFIGINGQEGFVTLDMMLARPEDWTARFVLSASLVWLVITAGATLAGLRGFRRKQL